MKQSTTRKEEPRRNRHNQAGNGIVVAETPPAFDDHFIREVRVQYQYSQQERFLIGSAEDVARFVRSHLVDNSREQLFALYLDTKHAVVSYSLISIGTANSTVVHPREVFQRAVLAGATAVIVAHNHPSGSCQPSEADRLITKRLREAGEVLGIPLLDHVIVTDDSFYALGADGLT